MSKGLIIDIGFQDDLEQYIKDIEEKLGSIDFDKSLGLKDAFKRQIEDVREELVDLKYDLEKLSDLHTIDELTDQMNTVKKATDALNKVVLGLVNKLSPDGMSDAKKALNSVAGELEGLQRTANDATNALAKVGKTNTLTKEQKKQSNELKAQYKLLNQIIAAQDKSESTLRPKANFNIDTIEQAYQNVLDLGEKYEQALEDGVSGLELDSILKEYNDAVVNTYRQIQTALSNDIDINEILPNFNTTLSLVREELAEAFDEIEQTVETRQNEIAQIFVNAGFGNISDYFQKKVKKVFSTEGLQEAVEGQDITVPISISTDDKTLANQALAVIRAAQAQINEPIKIGVVLVSQYTTNKYANIISQMQEQMSSLDDSEVKEKFSQLVDDLTKEIQGSLTIEFKVATESARYAVREFIKEVKETIQELNEQLISLTPEVVLTDENRLKFQQELQDAVNEVTANLGNIEISLPNLEGVLSNTFIPFTENIQQTIGEVWKQINLIEVRVKHIMDLVEAHNADNSIGEVWKMISLIETKVQHIMDLISNLKTDGVFEVQINPVIADSNVAKQNIIDELSGIEVPIDVKITENSLNNVAGIFSKTLLSDTTNHSGLTIGELLALEMKGDNLSQHVFGGDKFAREYSLFFNSLTGKASNPFVYGDHDSVPDEIIRLTYELQKYNTYVHSHPNGFIEPSSWLNAVGEGAGDVESFSKMLEAGITSDIILGQDLSSIFDAKSFFNSYKNIDFQKIYAGLSEEYSSFLGNELEQIKQVLLNPFSDLTNLTTSLSAEDLKKWEQIDFNSWDTNSQSLEDFLNSNGIEPYLTTLNSVYSVIMQDAPLINQNISELTRMSQFLNQKGLPDFTKYIQLAKTDDLIEKYNIPVDFIQETNNTNKASIEDIKSTINEINSLGSAYESINKLINNLGGKNGDTKLQNTVNGLIEIRNVLSSPIDENSLVKALQSLAEQGDNLENLATVLKATKKQIEQVQQNTITEGSDEWLLQQHELEQLMTNNAQEIRDKAEETLLSLGGQGSSLTNISNMSVTKDGFIEIIGLIEKADGTYQEFTLHTQDGINMINVGMKENTAQIAKQIKAYTQVEDWFNKRANMQADAALGGGFISKEEDPETWEMLLKFAEEYKEELGDIQSITYQTRQTSAGDILLESFSLNGTNGHLTVNRKGQTVASSQDLTNVQKVAEGWAEISKQLKRYNEIKLKGSSANQEELVEIQKIDEAVEQLRIDTEAITFDLGTDNMANAAMQQFDLMQTQSFDVGLQKIIDNFDKKLSSSTVNNKQYIKSFSNEIDHARGSISELTTLLNNHSDDSTPWDDDARAQVIAYINEINEVIAGLGNNENIRVGESQIDKMISKISELLNDNTAGKGSTTWQALETLRVQLISMRDDVEGVDKVKFTDLQNELNRLTADFKTAGKVGNSFFSQIVKAAKSSSAQFIARYFSLQDWIRYAQQAYQVVVSLDSALTELRKVSNATTERLAQSFEASAKTAQELGSTISHVINVTSNWSRLGYSVDEAEKLAYYTTMFQTVGDNMTADEANSYLISTLQGFQLEANEVERVIDKYNEVNCCLHI